MNSVYPAITAENFKRIGTVGQCIVYYFSVSCHSQVMFITFNAMYVLKRSNIINLLYVWTAYYETHHLMVPTQSISNEMK